MSYKVTLTLTFCLLLGQWLSVVHSRERATYENYRVYTVPIKNDQQLQIMKEFSNSDSLIFVEPISGKIGQKLQIVVAPHKLAEFIEILDDNFIDYELVNKNLQKTFDATNATETLNGRADYNWNTYYTLDTNYQWMQNMANLYPGIVSIVEAGKTYQGRSIMGVKISLKAGNRAVFLEAGIHAREWIAPATATYIINELVTSTNTDIRNIAQNYDWYIFPHANPDGYVYTHTTNRMWRKTRTPYGSCYGADPNRNWDAHWNTVGASNQPCSDTYAGPRAFSEKEVDTFASYISSLKNTLRLYISFHSYSQFLLYPYGYTSKLPANIKDIREVFTTTVAAVKQRYGTKYTGGNIYDAIYPASGSSIDWVRDKVGTNMTFCFELRPVAGSSNGFVLPTNQIVPTAQETLDGIVAMVNNVQKLGYFN